MAKYQEPGLQDRVKAAAAARAKALERLQAKAPLDPAIAAERAAKALEREAAQAEKRKAAQLEREAKIAARKEEAQRAAEAAAPPPQRTAEELKAARDARYAARKARKK